MKKLLSNIALFLGPFVCGIWAGAILTAAIFGWEIWTPLFVTVFLIALTLLQRPMLLKISTICMLAFVLVSSAPAADIVITIPDAQLPRALDAISLSQGYTGLNPQGGAETKAQFARRMLRNWVLTQIKQVEGAAAAESARATTNASIEAIAVVVN